MEYLGSDCYFTVILFSGERGIFLSAENIRGNGWDHLFVTHASLPNNTSMSKWQQKNNNTKLVIYPKYKLKIDSFYTSGYMLFWKFCQHHVDWKHVDSWKDHFWVPQIIQFINLPRGKFINLPPTLLHAAFGKDGCFCCTMLLLLLLIANTAIDRDHYTLKWCFKCF